MGIVKRRRGGIITTEADFLAVVSDAKHIVYCCV